MGHLRSKSLTIFLTDSCNLQCSYCYPGDYKQSYRTISFDFGISAINFFIGDQAGPCELKKVRFYALGEPTLEMDLIKAFHEHSLKVRPFDLTFEIQTNGTFSTKDAIWIAEHIDMVWISLDGPPDIHDKQRPFASGKPLSSYIILNNIQTLLKRGKCKIGIRPTITSRSIYRMREILNYAQSIGVHALYFHYAIKPQGRSVNTTGSIYQYPLIEYVKQYLETVVPFSLSKGLFVGDFLTINFDEESSYFCRSCLPSPHLTVDGYISACDKAPTGTDIRFSNMVFGQWNEKRRVIELFPEAINYLQKRKVENMTPCQDCEIKYNCGGGCLGEANFISGDIYCVNDEYCKSLKFLAKHNPRNTGSLFPFTHP